MNHTTTTRRLIMRRLGATTIAAVTALTITVATPANAATGDVTTIAGSSIGFADANGTNAKFSRPFGITVDPAGNLYIADTDNDRIRKIDTNNNVTTIAGSTGGYLDSNGTNAQFDNPIGISIDPTGNLYITDTFNHRIRKIDTNNNVTTIAGTGTPGFADANGTNAQFSFPFGITIDPTGNLSIADYGNNRIRKIDTNNNVTTIAGTGTPGSTDANGTNAKFNGPFGTTIDAAGNLYVTDAFNHRIRRIQGPPPPPPAAAPPIPQVTIAPIVLPATTAPTTAVATTTTAPSTTTPPTAAPATTTSPTTSASPTTAALPTTTAPAPSAITPATPLLAEPDFTG